jgi:Ca2+-binding RTX toxin-like protein
MTFPRSHTASALTLLLLFAGAPLALALPTASAEEPTCEGQPATIIGTAAPDSLSGTAADDVVWLGGEDVYGEMDVFVDPLGGNDLICQGGAGDAEIHAGPGDDTVHAVGGDGEGFTTIYGEDGVDRLDGGRLYGGAGDDVLTGGPGQSSLHGGPGADTISDGGGSDVVDGDEGDDQIDAGLGDDTVTGSPGSDTIDAGEGDDNLAYSHWQGKSIITQMESGVSMDLAAGTVTSDTGTTQAAGVECWIGTPYADTIDGSPDADCINGAYGGGADTIRALGGGDDVTVYFGSVSGGDGYDKIVAERQRLGEPADYARTVEVRGGSQSDFIHLRARRVRAFGGGGSDSFYMYQSRHAFVDGGADRNWLKLFYPGELDARAGIASFPYHGDELTLRFDHIRIFDGSHGRDVMRGSSAGEVFYGSPGRDLISGRGGDDRLDGQAGDDNLSGGKGADVALGGKDKDWCTAETERSCERNR